MLELGKRQLLRVVKKVEFGVYLAESAEESEKERVLLPGRQVPEGAEEGTEIEVFLYKDSKDRLIATVREPKLHLGEVALLQVLEVGKIGAFLDWGLEKDLLLPFREQTGKVKPGDSVLAALYIDKSQRLCATMKVYHYLKTQSPYVIGDSVEGRIYEISGNFGVFVAVDDRYSALIPKKDAQGSYEVGQKLKMCIRDSNLLSNLVLDQLMDWIMDGKLHMGEKLNPDELAAKLGVSKMPIREALNTLEKMGLAEAIPYVGTRLVKLTQEDVSEIYLIRKALEPLAAKQACAVIEEETAVSYTHLDVYKRQEQYFIPFPSERDDPVITSENVDNYIENIAWWK